MAQRPFLYITFFLASGTFLEQYLSWPLEIFFALTILVLVGAVVFMRPSPKTAVVLLLGAFFLLGIILTKGAQVLAHDHCYHVAKYYRGKTVALEGTIVSDVQIREFFRARKTSFVLEVERIKSPWGWQSKSGKVLVNLFREEPLHYGDRVRLEGKLHEPFEFSSDSRFSYRRYLYRKGIRLVFSMKKDGRVTIKNSGHGFWLKRLSLQSRDRLRRIIEDHFSPNEIPLMTTTLLGDGAQIPPHIDDLFIKTGTSHVLAISGFNIGIVTVVIFLLLRIFPIGRRWQMILTMVLLVFYAFLTGGRPPVVRATIMALVFLTSFLVQRESDGINSLGLAAFLIFLVSPFHLYDVGFQLSFISVYVILQYYPKLVKWLGGKKISQPAALWLLHSLSISIVAWLGVAGLIVYYFYMVTPVTVLANLVVVPLSSVMIALGLGMLIVGTFLPVLTFAFAACIKFVLNLMLVVIYFFSYIPGAYFYWKGVALWQVVVYYVLVWMVFQGYGPVGKGLKQFETWMRRYNSYH